MIKEDIRLYKLDLTGTDIHNKVSREFRSRAEVKNNHIFIPRHAPFYQESVRLYGKDGQPLTLGEDYEFYGIMGKLTQFTGKAVGLYIRLLKDEIKEWRTDYQVVGNFNKLTNETLNMLHSIHTDDRYVNWENIQNKPLWFVPELHQHDLAYDIFGFTDLVQQLGRLTDIMKVQNSPFDIKIETFQNNIDVYINGFKEVLDKLVTSHENNMKDAHGVTKHHLGLGRVDNIFTANLQQAIDGLRDDLRLTPLIAGQAAALAAGRNDRLFPSGSLPLLRYGSDTFIPPTITGSFEGMGIKTQVCGAIVEPDGTLLILHPRDDGRTSGLYFLRSRKHLSTSSEFEFTSYRYNHPTAIADGANLDAIINGSNDKVMIVGDSKKNIWYWCFTGGTFDPDRHILNRVTGDWVTMKRNWTKAHVLTTENYRSFFCIYQTHNADECKQIRPENPNIYALGGGVVEHEGMTFHMLFNGSGPFLKCIIDCPMANGKNYKDFLHTPYERKSNGGTPGDDILTEFHIKFTTPVNQIWTYRGVTVNVLEVPNKQDTLAFMASWVIWVRNKNGNSKGKRICYKSTIEFTRDATPVLKFTPGEGEKTLYEMDAFTDAPSEGLTQLNKWKDVWRIVNSTDAQSWNMLTPTISMVLGGYGGQLTPLQVFMVGFDMLGTVEGLLGPIPDTDYTHWFNTPIIYEYNPVGLGMSFINQLPIAMDSSNPTTGALMARQVSPTGETEWIVRPMDYLDNNWEHKAPGSNFSIDNKNVKGYPLVSEIKKTNLGPQMSLMNPVLKPGTPFVKKRLTRMFSADAWGNIHGKITRRDDIGDEIQRARAVGDGLMVMENEIKVINNVVSFIPKVVYNVRAVIDNVLKPALSSAGFDIAQVDSSWTINNCTSLLDGQPYQLFQAGRTKDHLVKAVAVVIRMTGTGTPVLRDYQPGLPQYEYYENVSVSMLSPIKIFDSTNDLVIDGFYAPYFTGGGVYEHTPIITYMDNRMDDSSQIVLTKTMTRSGGAGDALQLEMIYEIKEDLSDIIRVARHATNHVGPERRFAAVAYYGIGSTDYTLDSMGRAGNVLSKFLAGPQYGQGIWDALSKNQVDNEWILGMSNLLSSTYTVYFQEKKNVLLGGKMYDIPAQYIDIRDFEPNPANKTFYVYLVFTGVGIGYQLSRTVIPETSTNGMIATVYCGPEQITRIVPFNKFTMDGAQVSAVRQGSAILASTGSVFDVGETNTILLPGDFV